MSSFKKCPRCGLDKWLKDLAPSGYCKDCARLLGRLAGTKARTQHREEFNEYHRNYRKRRHSGFDTTYGSLDHPHKSHAILSQ